VEGQQVAANPYKQGVKTGSKHTFFGFRGKTYVFQIQAKNISF